MYIPGNSLDNTCVNRASTASTHVRTAQVMTIRVQRNILCNSTVMNNMTKAIVRRLVVLVESGCLIQIVMFV